MKFASILLSLIILETASFAQHIIVPHHQPHGTSRICWGYAMGRAGGKSPGDATCDPESLIPDYSGIDPSYFDLFSWSERNSKPLQSGDILYWPSIHAAHVTSVPWVGNEVDVENIVVDHTSAQWTADSLGVLLSHVKDQFGVGNPQYFCRKKKFNLTLENDFSGYSGGYAYYLDYQDWEYQVNSGTATPLLWSGKWKIKAENQNYQASGEQDYYRVFSKWWKGIADLGNTNPQEIQLTGNLTFTAEFRKQFDILFLNALPAASGGQVKVNDIQYNAPHIEHVIQGNAVTSDAFFQVIDRIEYTFSYWTNNQSGDTTWSPTLNLTPADHVTYTAHFTSKPQWPADVWAGGSVDQNIQVTWTEHPNSCVTQYQIWRRVKDNGVLGSPEQVATVNRGTTSWTDYEFVVTPGYTEDLVYYDVRSVFVVSAQPTQYSDPNYTDAVYGSNSTRAELPQDNLDVLDVTRKPAFEIGSFPNPFNPETEIRFSLPEPSRVSMTIVDITGREVASWAVKDYSSGYHRLVWRGRNRFGNQVSSGVYFFRLIAVGQSGQDYSRVLKLLLQK